MSAIDILNLAKMCIPEMMFYKFVFRCVKVLSLINLRFAVLCRSYGEQNSLDCLI